MSNTPPNAPLFCSNRDSSKERIVNKGRAILPLIIALLAVPANATNESAIKADAYGMSPQALEGLRQHALKLDDLLSMSWEDIEARLEQMNSVSQVEHIIDLLAPVRKESKPMISIVRKLKAGQPFEESEKNFILQLADEYGLSTLSNLQYIFEKETLTPTDARFVTIQVKTILKLQSHRAELCAKVRMWLINSPDFEVYGNMRSQVDAYLDLAKALADYERSF
jgi:hypothetical protein